MNESSAATTNVPATERIEEVLDSIRPAIRADGGDIELVGFDELDGIVRIRMVGACYACPMSMLTLRARYVREIADPELPHREEHFRSG